MAALLVFAIVCNYSQADVRPDHILKEKGAGLACYAGWAYCGPERDGTMNDHRSDKSPRPAVFLDRDGTIIEDRGDLARPSQVAFFADTFPALKRLNRFFELFIVTNQSGVSKGAMTIEDVKRVNTRVVSELARFDIRIRETYVCPHKRDDGCRCIKPKPYFLRKAETDHGIDLTRSFAIGDHPHDVTFAENVGAKGIYVLSGHGEKHRDELSGDVVVVGGIREAADHILGPDGRESPNT